MYDIRPQLKLRDIFAYAIAYMFWLLAALVALVAVFMIRMALNAFWPVTGWNRWLLRPIDRFGLLFLGIVWLVYVIFCEQYFRSSITEVRVRRMNASMRVTPRPETTVPNGFMRAMARLGLDVLARRLVLTFAIPLAVLGLAYLVYWAAWRLIAA
jgi:uncharacterized membrane protein